MFGRKKNDSSVSSGSSAARRRAMIEESQRRKQQAQLPRLAERPSRRSEGGDFSGGSDAEQSSFDMSTFRRGTTLNTFANNRDEKTERQKLKRLRTLRRRMVAVLLIIIIILAGGVAVLSQFTNSISTVATTDGAELSEADVEKYEGIVNDYFSQNSSERFSFVRRNSVLLQYVESQAPEVSDIKLVTSSIASSKIEITVRKPVAMWIDGSDVSYVDNTGVVFKRNYYETPSIAIEDDSGVDLDGAVATSSRFLSFVGKTATAIEATDGMKVVRVVIPQGSARYVEFYLDGRDYPFKAQITRDSASQASDIVVMARYIDSHGLSPAYVDCRVEGKAYWK